MSDKLREIAKQFVRRRLVPPTAPLKPPRRSTILAYGWNILLLLLAVYFGVQSADLKLALIYVSVAVCLFVWPDDDWQSRNRL